ncbi:MAG: hypothetical protein ACREJU_09345 [Nitrospiraceae bacterium]
MTCSRCAGLMVEDYFINIDIDAPSGTEKLAAWRCINCGDIVEKNRCSNRLRERCQYDKKGYEPPGLKVDLSNHQ